MWQCSWLRNGSGNYKRTCGRGRSSSCRRLCHFLQKASGAKKIVPRGHDCAVREVQRALEHAGEVVRLVGRLGEQAVHVQQVSGEEDAHLLVALDYADRVPVGGSLDRLIYEVQASDRAEGLYVQGGHDGRKVCELEGGRVVEEQRVQQEGKVVPRVRVADPILGGAGGREIPVYWLVYGETNLNHSVVSAQYGQYLGNSNLNNLCFASDEAYLEK